VSSAEAVARVFDLQAGWCTAMGSRFMAELMGEVRDDVSAGGVTAALIGDWPSNPLADALPMRFAGALHAAALSGRDPVLAALYPRNGAAWDAGAVWAAVQDFIVRERDWVVAFLTDPPQTNETRRAIGLLPAFLACARHGPLHLLEIGASAGLNLMWDRFRFETPSWSWGVGEAPVITTDWQGPPPADLDARVMVAARAGCDRNPLDVHDPEHVLRLRAYLWPDQPERLQRLDAALALSQREGVRPEQADAAAWLTQRLAALLPEGVTVIYHSVVWQYLPPETKRAATAAIEAAAMRADDAHRLTWVRFEANAVLGLEGALEEMSVELLQWPGGVRRIMSRVDPHARWVKPI
jgi:hypothetical protein